jgi:hypothetical protein
MLLSEMERQLSKDKVLLYNPSEYSVPVNWGLACNYGNVTLPEAGILIFNFQACVAISGYVTNPVLFVDGKPAYGVYVSQTSYASYGSMVWLDAGTYNISVYGEGTYTGKIKEMRVGFAKFNDCAGYKLQSSTNATLSLASRKTLLGQFSKAVFAIIAGGLAPVNDVTSISSIRVDDVSQTIDQQSGPYRACTALCFVPLTTDQNHTIQITLSNANATPYLSVIACPWILPAGVWEYTPFSQLSIPHFSTLYVYLHYLFNNVTKEFAVGKKHGVSFGSLDYYHYQSGTGPLLGSYTFDVISPLDVTFMVAGLGGCIEAIAVDIT